MITDPQINAPSLRSYYENVESAEAAVVQPETATTAIRTAACLAPLAFAGLADLALRFYALDEQELGPAPLVTQA